MHVWRRGYNRCAEAVPTPARRGFHRLMTLIAARGRGQREQAHTKRKSANASVEEEKENGESSQQKKKETPKQGFFLVISSSRSSLPHCTRSSTRLHVHTHTQTDPDFRTHTHTHIQWRKKQQNENRLEKSGEGKKKKKADTNQQPSSTAFLCFKEMRRERGAQKRK